MLNGKGLMEELATSAYRGLSDLGKNYIIVNNFLDRA